MKVLNQDKVDRLLEQGSEACYTLWDLLDMGEGIKLEAITREEYFARKDLEKSTIWIISDDWIFVKYGQAIGQWDDSMGALRVFSTIVPVDEIYE